MEESVNGGSPVKVITWNLGFGKRVSVYCEIIDDEDVLMKVAQIVATVLPLHYRGKKDGEAKAVILEAIEAIEDGDQEGLIDLMDKVGGRIEISEWDPPELESNIPSLAQSKRILMGLDLD